MAQEKLPETPLRHLSRRRWWREVILGITLFACGFLVGGVVVTKHYIARVANVARNGIDRQQATARLQRMLDLDEEQAQQVQTILSKGLDDLRDIRQSVRPQVDATLQRVRAEVSSLLHERQKRIWERRFDLLRERWFPSIPENADDGKGSSRQ